MHPIAALAGAAALLATSVSADMLNVLDARQTSNGTDEAYLQKVCFPPSTDPVPPCQSIINIQTACEPNGTSPLALLAHAECMCGGSFFSDWIGCLNCNFVHGGRSPQVVSAFNTIITSASHALCTGTPTASFAAIFSGLSDDSGVAEGSAATQVSDQFPNQTAVSLYFTATGSQGPGSITGSAAGATATGVTRLTGTVSTSASASASGSASGSQTTSKSGTAGASSAATQGASTSSSKAGAAPTGVWVRGMGIVAGGFVMAAL